MTQAIKPQVKIYFDGTDITELLALANFLSTSEGELSFNVTSAKPDKKRAQPRAVTREPTPRQP
jgi:hypothetical protein